jgi:hypothetical protein
LKIGVRIIVILEYNMKRFTHGIMVIDPLNPDDDDDNVTVIHFVGYWKEPTDEDADRLREELRIDPDFKNYRDIVDRLIMYPATKDCLKYYNDQAEADGIFDEPNLN